MFKNLFHQPKHLSIIHKKHPAYKVGMTSLTLFGSSMLLGGHNNVQANDHKEIVNNSVNLFRNHKVEYEGNRKIVVGKYSVNGKDNPGNRTNSYYSSQIPVNHFAFGYGSGAILSAIDTGYEHDISAPLTDKSNDNFNDYQLLRSIQSSYKKISGLERQRLLFLIERKQIKIQRQLEAAQTRQERKTNLDKLNQITELINKLK